MDVGTGIELSSDTWNFGQSAPSFDAHIVQSVPHCQEQRDYVADLSRYFLHEGAEAIEVGVSTGRTAEAVLGRVRGRRIRYTGIDVEPRMVRMAMDHLAYDDRFEAVLGDAVTYDFTGASLVISYYTLQFVPWSVRQATLARISRGICHGGALILYEKTLANSARVQQMLDQLYCEFKTSQGLSAEAIAGKAKSLQGVADPMSLEQNRRMLVDAGFGTVETIFRSHCFSGFLAVKE